MAISTYSKESQSFWAGYRAELLGRLHGADERRSVDSMEGRCSVQARPVLITCKASEPVAKSCSHFLGMHVPPSSEGRVKPQTVLFAAFDPRVSGNFVYAFSVPHYPNFYFTT